MRFRNDNSEWLRKGILWKGKNITLILHQYYITFSRTSTIDIRDWNGRFVRYTIRNDFGKEKRDKSLIESDHFSYLLGSKNATNGFSVIALARRFNFRNILFLPNEAATFVSAIISDRYSRSGFTVSQLPGCAFKFLQIKFWHYRKLQSPMRNWLKPRAKHS